MYFINFFNSFIFFYLIKSLLIRYYIYYEFFILIIIIYLQITHKHKPQRERDGEKKIGEEKYSNLD